MFLLLANSNGWIDWKTEQGAILHDQQGRTLKPDKTKDPKWLTPITQRNDRIFCILLMLRHLLKATAMIRL